MGDGVGELFAQLDEGLAELSEARWCARSDAELRESVRAMYTHLQSVQALWLDVVCELEGRPSSGGRPGPDAGPVP